MNIQIYFLKKNFDVQKAERYFKERNIPYQSVDLSRHTLGMRELLSIKAQVGLKALVDTDSKRYAESTLRFLREENTILEALAADSRLLRTPIVRNGRYATVGFQPDVWAEWV